MVDIVNLEEEEEEENLGAIAPEVPGAQVPEIPGAEVSQVTEETQEPLESTLPSTPEFQGAFEFPDSLEAQEASDQPESLVPENREEREVLPEIPTERETSQVPEDLVSENDAWLFGDTEAQVPTEGEARETETQSNDAWLFGDRPARAREEQEEADELDLEDSYTLSGEFLHLAREAGAGIASIPDLGLALTSMYSFLPTLDAPEFNESERKIYRETVEAMGFVERAQQVLGIATGSLIEGALGIPRNLGDLATTALKEDLSVEGLFNRAVPKTTAKTTAGKWGGIAAKGAAQSLTLGVRLLSNAKSLKSLDDAPAFLRPIYHKLRQNPGNVLKQEAWSGAFAALTSIAAVDFYMANVDNPDPATATAVALISGAFGGSVRRPEVLLVAPAKGAAVTVKVVAAGTRAVAGKMMDIARKGADDSEFVKIATTEHHYGKVAMKVGEYLEGPRPKEAAKSLIEETQSNPTLKLTMQEIVDNVNVTGDFKANLVSAQKTADVIEGLQLTSPNISDDAIARGLGQDFAKIAPKAQLKVYKGNIAAVKVFFNKVFAGGDAGDIRRVVEMAKIRYNETIKLTHETVKGIERALGDLRISRELNNADAGTVARTKVQVLKDAFKVMNDVLYDIDPMNQIRVPATTFSRILSSPEFSNMEQTNVLGNRLREIYGKALAATLEKRLRSGDIPDNLPGTPGSTPVSTMELAITMARKGDAASLKAIPKNLREIFYTDASDMIKDMRAARTDLVDITSPTGGRQASVMGDIMRTTNDELLARLRTQGSHKTADQRMMADDFYATYMGGYFDPAGTASGKMLKQNNSAHFAVAESDVLASVFNKPDELRKFLAMATPENSVLVNPGASPFARFLGKDLVDAEEVTTVMNTLRKSLEDHAMNEALNAAKRGATDPRGALVSWMESNRESLKYLPGVNKELTKMSQSNSLGSEVVAQAQAARRVALATQKERGFLEVLGEGNFGVQARGALLKPAVVKELAEALDATDVSGSMRQTFVSGAIRDALTPDESGIISPVRIHEFLSTHGEGLRKIATKETMDHLETLAQGSKIVQRSSGRGSPVELSDPARDISWIAKELPVLWTTLRKKEMHGINSGYLAFLHGGRLATNEVLKLNKSDLANVTRVYGEILSDPKALDEMATAIAKWKDARTTTARNSALDNASLTLAGFGMPITALPGLLDEAGDIAEVNLEVKEEEPEKTQETSDLITSDAQFGELGRIENADGSTSTEFSITENIPELGGWVNIPTLVKGQTDTSFLSSGDLTDEQRGIAIKRAKERVGAGASLPSYKSLDEAVKAAESRTEEEKLRPYE